MGFEDIWDTITAITMLIWTIISLPYIALKKLIRMIE
jgi:hypothetical protein